MFSLVARPLLRIGLVMTVSLPICWAMVQFARRDSLIMVGAVAAGGLVVLVAESYFVFDLKDVWQEFQNRKLRNIIPRSALGS